MERNLRLGAALLGVVLLAGCATVPTGPAVRALPGTRTAPGAFAGDDYACRGQAQAYVNPNAARAANDAAAGNVVGGTLLGATVGALIGAAAGDAGAGAAIGAGMGMLGGSAVAADMSGFSTAQLQALYDRAYLDCMYARGHRVPAPAVTYRSRSGPYAVPPGAAEAPRDAPPPRAFPPPSTRPPAIGFPPADTPPPPNAR